MAEKIIRLAQLTTYDTRLKLYLSQNYALASAIPTVPTTVSSFTNDAGYQNASQVSSAINTAIAGISGITFQIVQTLPQTGDAGTIYLVLSSQSATGDIYDEWIYINNAWEKIGSTAVDLTDYTVWNSTNETLSANGTVVYQFATDAEIALLFS